MPLRFGRPIQVGTGITFGFIAAMLTIATPWLIGQVGLPIPIFTGAFIGDIFGIVFAVYFWIFLGERSIWRSVGFAMASAVAYMAAEPVTIFSTGIMPRSPGGPWASTGTDVSVGGFLVGGAVGGFIVVLAALLCFPGEKSTRLSLVALLGSAAGAILGGLGWAAGPSLGNPILSVIGGTANPYTNAQEACTYSLFLVWQTGMGLTIGWLFSRDPVEAPAGSAPAPVPGSDAVPRLVRIALFAAVALICVFTVVREFPGNYQNAKWQRAYKKRLAEQPPLVNLPNPSNQAPSPKASPLQEPERPSLENLPGLQPVAPEKMLILRQFGEYVPSNVRPEPLPKTPATAWYSVRYANAAPSSSGNSDRVTNVQVQVTEYPNAAWARYKISQHGSGAELTNPAKVVKFGTTIYGQVQKSAGWHVASYSWRSGNRIIALWSYSVDSEDILKAYLQKFPASEMPALDNTATQFSESPSLEDLPEVQLVAPKQRLIVQTFGEYSPSDVRSGKTVARSNPWVNNQINSPNSQVPAALHYSVHYTVPDAAPIAGNLRPKVEVYVEEYPNAAWAHYEVLQRQARGASANAPRPVKFGSFLYGHEEDGAKGRNGSYMWASGNRLISMSFDLAAPDEILKAYLEKFPTSEKASPEDIGRAQAADPREILKQVLLLQQFGAYLPQRPSMAMIMRPPTARYYTVRYALPKAPTMGDTGPTVDVHVYEYANAALAKYEISGQGGRTDLANPARPVKFGSRIYGQAQPAAARQNGAYTNGQNGEYVWASGNRLIVVQAYSAEPDEIVKAYLAKFLPPASDRL